MNVALDSVRADVYLPGLTSRLKAIVAGSRERSKGDVSARNDGACGGGAFAPPSHSKKLARKDRGGVSAEIRSEDAVSGALKPGLVLLQTRPFLRKLGYSHACA